MRRISMMLLGMLAATMVHAADDGFQIGAAVHVGQGRNGLSATNTALANAGITFRDEVYWGKIETQKGTLAYPTSLNDLEQLVNDAVARKRSPILILDYGNKFYDNGALISSPEAIDGYCRYATFVVKHFAGRVRQFEIWNEWNIGMGAHPLKPQSAESYVNVLRAAYKAIKAANPNAIVLGGVMNGTDQNWVEAFGKAGGFSYLDAYSVHPYEFWYATTPKPPGGLKLTALQTSESFVPIHGTPEAAIGKLDGLKAQIDQFAPGRNIRVYVTEVGWPTNQGKFGSSEQIAAAYLQRFLALARTRQWVAGVWWYDLFDDGDDDPTNKENRYGLLHHDGSPKPAYQALLDVASILQSPGTFSASLAADGTAVVSGKGADGKNVKIIWVATNDLSGQEAVSGSSATLVRGFHSAAASSSAAIQISATPSVLVEQ